MLLLKYQTVYPCSSCIVGLPAGDTAGALLHPRPCCFPDTKGPLPLTILGLCWCFLPLTCFVVCVTCRHLRVVSTPSLCTPSCMQSTVYSRACHNFCCHVDASGRATTKSWSQSLSPNPDEISPAFLSGFDQGLWGPGSWRCTELSPWKHLFRDNCLERPSFVWEHWWWPVKLWGIFRKSSSSLLISRRRGES